MTNRVSIEDLKSQLGLLDRNCDKEFEQIDRRMKKLGDWIQTDTDKFAKRIDNIQAITDEFTDKVKNLDHVVSELRAQETRNDEFMQ